MSMDGVSLLAEDSDQCPWCHKPFSTTEDGDSLETYLSCGHSVCFKCVQIEWCRSSTNDADTVSCPLCNDQALICFDRDAAMDVDEQTSKSGCNNMSDVLRKVQDKVSQDNGGITSGPGCCDVLMSQSTETTSRNDCLQQFPMSMMDTFISMADIDPLTDINSIDLSDSLGFDKCWPIEGINIQEILEKKIDDTEVVKKQLTPDSMFTKSEDNDIGSVQDILKIVNLPNEALLNERSLSGFLEDHLHGNAKPSQSVKKNVSNDEVSQISDSFHSTSGNGPSWPSDIKRNKPHLEGVNIHIKDSPHFSFANFPNSLDGENMFISEDYSSFRLSRGRGRGRGRGKKRYIRGRRKSILSTATRNGSLDFETMAAVAAIQQPDEMEYTDGSDGIDTLKDNLHERFYPRVNKKSEESEPVYVARTDTVYEKPVIDNKEEIDLPDMQMVKIVSDVDLPDTSAQSDIDTETLAKNNYGYVKNSMLPNGNEIKNLYVVPKTWLNKNEVEVQFAPTDFQHRPQSGEGSEVDGSSSYALHATDIINSSTAAKEHLEPEDFRRLLHENPGTPIKVWSKDDSQQTSPHEIYITKLPERDAIQSDDKPASETVHVRYEVNDGQLQFLPSLTENNKESKRDPLQVSETEKEPLLILAIKEDQSGSSASTRPNSDCATVDQGTNTEQAAGVQVPNVKQQSFLCCYDMNIEKPIKMSQYSHRVETIKNDIGRKIIKVKISRKVVPRPDGCAPNSSISPESSQNKTTSTTNTELATVTVDSKQLSKSEALKANESEVILTPEGVCRDADNSTDLIKNATKDFTSCHSNGLCLESCECLVGAATDYGSPPQLERADEILPSCQLEANSNGTKKRETDQIKDTSSTKTPDLKADDQYKTLWNKLSELEKGQINTEDISILNRQISRLQSMKKRFGVRDRHSQVLYDMAMSQVFSLVASETSVQLMEANAVLLEEQTLNEMCTHVELIRRVTKQGARFITAIANEYERLINKLGAAATHTCVSDVIDLTLQDPEDCHITKTGDYENIKSIESSDPKPFETDEVHLISDDFNEKQTILSKLLKETSSSQDQFVTNLNQEVPQEEERFSASNVDVSSDTLFSSHGTSTEPTGTDERSNDFLLEDIHQNEEVQTCSHVNVTCLGNCKTAANSETVICVVTAPNDTENDSVHTLECADPTNSEDVINHAHITEGLEGGSLEVQHAESVHVMTNNEETSPSSASMVAYDTNIALNLEIASQSTSSSSLPSLSDIMKHSDHTSKKATPQSATSLDSEHGSADPDYKPEDDFRSSSSDDDEDHDEGRDDHSDNSKCTPRKVGNSHEQSQEKGKTGSKRKGVQPDNKLKGTPRKCRRRGSDSESSTPRSSRSTPKTPRSSVSNTPTRPSSTSRRSKRSKKHKMKSIYASSSEEIIPAPVVRGFKDTDACFKIFNSLYNDHCSDPFSDEILSAEFPDYYKVVKRGMWLDLIAHKLRSGKYGRLEDFVADMRLVFKNSCLFNKKGTQVYRSGVTCSEMFEKLLTEQFPDKEFPDIPYLAY